MEAVGNVGPHTVGRHGDPGPWLWSRAALASVLINSNFGCHLTFQSLIFCLQNGIKVSNPLV